MVPCIIIVLTNDFVEKETRVHNCHTPPGNGDLICFEDGGMVYSVVVRIHGESLKVIVEPTSLDGGPKQEMNREKVLKLQRILSKHRYKNIYDQELPY